MKFIIVIIIIFASYPLFATEKGLPKHFDMTELKLQSIPYSKVLFVNATVTIPNNHKSTGTPSALNIYEKMNGQWAKTASLDAQSLFTNGNKITISGKVNLQSSTSDIAIDSTIYHCGKYCVINNFQGFAKRSHNVNSKTLNVSMKGYLPTDKLKSI